MTKSINSKFESISPSAIYLLLTKAATSIPFAKEAADLILEGKNLKVIRENNDLNSLGFKLRCIHFETRYRSIDEALSTIGLRNILEFSSGLSFRGLDWCKNNEICYIDTDLAKMLELKKKIVLELKSKYCTDEKLNLILKELDVLDENAFKEIIDLFPPGPIVIVNEGLLMYFDIDQKRTLCKNIYNILSKRGGYWITADVYRKKDEQSSLSIDIFDSYGRDFLTKHRTSENEFESFESAEEFFKSCGFKVYKKIEVPPTKISSRAFLRDVPRDILLELKNRKKRRETWILEVESC